MESSTDLISNPVYDYCSPSLSAKRGSIAETSSQYRCTFIALSIFLLLTIVFFLLGCSLGYQYSNMETKFQEKCDSLNDYITDVREKTNDLEAIISSLTLNFSATKAILGEVAQKNLETYDTFTSRARIVEKNLSDLNSSSHALVEALEKNWRRKIESVGEEMKNLEQRISFVDNTTSFLMGTINVTNGNVMHLNSRTQEILGKLDDLNIPSLKGSIQNFQQEVSNQKTTLEKLDSKHEDLKNKFTQHVG